MAFTTKLDYSDNRQIKQHIGTHTELSGGTSFGISFNDLPMGPDLYTSGITETYGLIASTFSGNNTTTNFTWYDNRMELAHSTLSAITPSTSATTQIAGPSFAPSSYITVDGNSIATGYSGVTYDLSVITMIDLGSGTYSGTVETETFDVLSAGTNNYTGRTIWADVSGKTRTEELIITKAPNIGDIFTCIDAEGLGAWLPNTGGTGSTSSAYWSAGTGYSAIVTLNSTNEATNDYAVAEGFETIATGRASHAEGSGTTAGGDASHAEGWITQALGEMSHAEGYFTRATALAAHSEGLNTQATDESSHSEGSHTQSRGHASHAEGFNVIVYADFAHGEGYYSMVNPTANGGHAEGYQTLVDGEGAHSEGKYSAAMGEASHAEGYSSSANGYASHAEGNGTIADGNYSHAQGNGSQANSPNSHAGGEYSIANGYASFVHGQNSVVNGNHSIILGANITGNSDNTTYVEAFNIKTLGGGTSINNLGIDINGNVVIGTTGGGGGTDVYVTGGTYNNLTGVATFRNNTGGTFNVVGFNTSGGGGGSAYWSASTGTDAIVTLNSTNIASGTYAVAEGRGTSATGDSSHAEGSGTTAGGAGSHAEGWQTLALAELSHAEGRQTVTMPNAYCSHVEGLQTTGTSEACHAEGAFTLASGNSAHAEGNSTIAGGTFSHAEGYFTRALGNSAHAEGYRTSGTGDYSHAEGSGTSAVGTYSHAEGASTIASGQISHAEGQLSRAYGYCSHAEGSETKAWGAYSHAQGIGTQTSGLASHAEGYQSVANGDYSHSQGFNTQANGIHSFVAGSESYANGDYSFAYGSASTASSFSTFVLGSGINGTQANTTYVDGLNIKTVPAGPGTIDIGVDATGRVVNQASDIRLKENINTIENALDTVLKLRGVTYNWKDRESGGNDLKIGLIAQEVLEVVPELVTNNGEYLGVQYKDIPALLIEAIKELVSGETEFSKNFLETQTILAEDNNIELNYNGSLESSTGGGIKVLRDTENSSDFLIDANGDWCSSVNIKSEGFVIPTFTPKNSDDKFGIDGNITKDDDFIYIKTNNKWKRTKLEEF